MLSFFAANWLGIVGFVSGIACVWLLIRENILTFPIGLVYALVTVVVMLNARLYADVLLNLYFVVMNAYGWYFWLYGARQRRHDDQLDVARLPVQQWLGVTVAGLLLTGAMGWYFSSFTDADFAYADSFTTVLSFVAMWMAAKKYIENWWLWLVVNVISVILYCLKAQSDSQLYFYAALYAIYTAMAFAGYAAWRKRLAKPVALVS